MANSTEDTESSGNNEQERPTPDPDAITIGEIMELEEAAGAGDAVAQQRLAEIEGVESYEKYMSLPERTLMVVQSTDASTAGILKALNNICGPLMERTSGLLAGIAETAIAPKLWDSLAQDSALKATSLLADELSKETQDAFRLASMPWTEDIQKQMALMTQAESPAFRHYAELAAEKDAVIFGTESMRQLAESMGQLFAEYQQSLTDKFGVSLSAMTAPPLQELAQSVNETLKRMKPSAAELAGLTLNGKDLLGAGTAPELRLETSFMDHLYVSPQEHILEEILAELREQRIGNKQKKRQWALISPARGEAPKQDKPVLPRRGRSGRHHLPDDLWAWEEVNRHQRPPSDVYKEWLQREGVQSRNLVDPHRQFDRITKPDWGT